jgi:hypothetical protein
VWGVCFCGCDRDFYEGECDESEEKECFWEFWLILVYLGGILRDVQEDISTAWYVFILPMA